MTDIVCAVMVTHNAGNRPHRVASSIMPQVDFMVVVDNASDGESLRILDELALLYSGRVSLIKNSSNVWMAAALNQGISFAQDRGATHALLTSDADILSPNAVAAMLEVFNERGSSRVGSVNPRVILGSVATESLENSAPMDLKFPVTGGCLLSLAAVSIVGPQREDFFIDFVDFDYGFRLRAAGFGTLGLNSVSLAGELGRTTSRRFLWRRCSVHNYSATRRYFFARNGLILIKERPDRDLAMFYITFLASSLLKILIYETDKFIKARAIGAGVRDGFRGQLDPGRDQ